MVCSATGILKGYDQLLNLVLDGTVEHLQGTFFQCWSLMMQYVYVYVCTFDQ